MHIYIDLKKADDNTGAPKINVSSGAIPAGSKKQSKYGTKVWHRGKDRYPKRPNNALGETDTTWVLPYGQKPQYSGNSNTAESNKPSSEGPTPEEHEKLSNVAREMGNTKLADKHAELSKVGSKSSYEVDPKYQSKIDNLNRGDKGKYSHSIENISLNDIDIPEAWSKDKYTQAENDIKSGKKLDPIRAEIGDNGKYIIDDGIHRANAAKKLGHSHIPVHVVGPYKENKKTTTTDNTKDRESKRVPETDQEKAQNLIHNAKASEAKKKAKEVLRAVPSEHKQALEKIIQVLEDHETRPHVPSNQEKRELKEIVSTVNSIAKPVEKKRAAVNKEFEKQMAEKKKQDQRIYIKTEKSKEKEKALAEKAKEKEARLKEKEDKERQKVADKKQKEYNKLKQRLDRDIKKPGSIEEEAQKATHVSEAKEVLLQIDSMLKENKDPDLNKLLEAHRSVAQRQLDLSRLPTKEDIKALRETKKVIQQKSSKESKEKTSSQQNDNSSQTQQSTTQGQSSYSKTRNSYNTGRAAGETVSHQATEESGGQLTGKTAGAIGYGVASAGHKLLTDEDDNKVKIRGEIQKAVDAVFGIDSETGRNTDTFDDEQPVGQGSDLPNEDDINKCIIEKLGNLLPNRFNTKKEFLINQGAFSEEINKSLSHITGLKKSRYNKYLCTKMKHSIDRMLKSF